MSSYFSASRFLKRNNVMTKEPPVTSRAAYVLLIHSYIKSFDLPDWVKWIRFRDEWMEEQFELHGGLVYCPACGKGPPQVQWFWEGRGHSRPHRTHFAWWSQVR